MSILSKIIKGIAIFTGVVVIGGAATCFAAKKINGKTPDGGINETEFVDINGSEQWVNIYGQDKNAPVLLYLHGGPFGATSANDWTCLRKLSNDYIVVNWDQRGCGHNYPDHKEATAPTSDTMMQDGREMTDYLRERFGKDKITLMGHSWGSLLGANLVLESPEKYDAMIALSLDVDIEESQKIFKEYMLEKTTGDTELHALAESIDVTAWSMEQRNKIMPLMMKYSYIDNYFKDADVNFYTTLLFNPNCTLSESMRMVFGNKGYNDYLNNTLRPEPADVIAPLQLSGKTEYKVPFYLVEGKEDHGDITMVEEAEAYYEKITAPDKDILYLDGGHNAPLMKTEQLAEFVHKIAEKNK